MEKRIKKKHLVSLNTARIKLRKQHPRISEDLNLIFQVLKAEMEILDGKDPLVYKDDGYLDIED